MCSTWSYVVGPTGGGKTAALHVLRDALRHWMVNQIISSSNLYTLNPKAVTMGELYGEFDAITHEWTDGLVPTVVRGCVADASKTRKWVCLMVLLIRYGLNNEHCVG